MSFDRSPQRQQEPSDLPSSASPSHNDHRLPPASSFGLRPISGPAPTAAPLTTPTTTAAPVKMEERDGPSPTGAGGSHYGGPSLPPPSAMHPHQRDQHQSHYQHQHQQHQQHHYAEYKSEYKSEYSRPPPTTTASTSSSLPFASSSTSAAPIWDYSDRSAYSSADQQPIAQYQARDYPRAHNLPSLPADISPSPYTRQPTTSAFDPIRSSQVAEPSTQTVSFIFSLREKTMLN
ncbi:hypothetical protein BCR43DRAFT_10965 [Syncephalastrum racemosum]|uniref:Uncharacterized protein n=1 Tax=Syncephalastrum racemosum TaxID=13706 RepID=A0A1X2HSA2_SYNRA|nr:hypothetical protein BCR43DRAFT_10965 [Syncephalastrum racemosum]